MDHGLLSKKQLLQLREAAAGRKAIGGARGLVKEIMRLSDGTFAPKGRGKFLEPGSTVKVPSRSGSGFVKGVVKNDPDFGVDGVDPFIELQDGPDAGQRIKFGTPYHVGGDSRVKDLPVGAVFDDGSVLTGKRVPNQADEMAKRAGVDPLNDPEDYLVARPDGSTYTMASNEQPRVKRVQGEVPENLKPYSLDVGDKKMPKLTQKERNILSEIGDDLSDETNNRFMAGQAFDHDLDKAALEIEMASWTDDARPAAKSLVAKLRKLQRSKPTEKGSISKPAPQTPGGTAVTKDGKIGINRDPGAELAKPKPPRTPGQFGVAGDAALADAQRKQDRQQRDRMASLSAERSSAEQRLLDRNDLPDRDDEKAYTDAINAEVARGKAAPQTPGVPGSGDGFVDNAEAPDPTSIKDLPIGTEFKLKNGDTYVVHKHTGSGAVGKIVKLSDGTTTGKAKFFNGMLAPKQVKIPDGAEAPKPKKPKAPGGLNLKNAGPSGKPRNVKAMSDSKLLQLAKHPDVEPDLLDRVEAELTKRGKEMPSQKLGKPGMFNVEPTGDALDSAISKKKGGKGGSPYENRVREFEDMGMTTSDAQSAADVEVYDGKLKGDAFHDFIKGQQDAPAMASASVSAMSYADIPSLKKGTKLNLENTGPSGKLRNIKAMQPAKLKALIEHPDVDPELRDRARKQLAAKGYDVPGAGGAGVPKQPAISGSSSEHDFGSPEVNAILEPIHSMFKGSGLGEGSPSGSSADKFVSNYESALSTAKSLGSDTKLPLKPGGTFSISKRSEAGVDEYSVIKGTDGNAAIDPNTGESMVYDSPEIAAAHAVAAEFSVGGPNEPTSDVPGEINPNLGLPKSGVPSKLTMQFVDDIQFGLSSDEGFTSTDFQNLEMDVQDEIGEELDQDGNPLWGATVDDVLENVIKRGFVKPENLDALLKEHSPGSGKAAVAERKRLKDLVPEEGFTGGSPPSYSPGGKYSKSADAPSNAPVPGRLAKAWEAYSAKLEEFKFFDDMGNKKERARKAAQVRAAKGRFIKAGGDIENPPNFKAAPQTPGGKAFKSSVRGNSYDDGKTITDYGEFHTFTPESAKALTDELNALVANNPDGVVWQDVADVMRKVEDEQGEEAGVMDTVVREEVYNAFEKKGLFTKETMDSIAAETKQAVADAKKRNEKDAAQKKLATDYFSVIDQIPHDGQNFAGLNDKDDKDTRKILDKFTKNETKPLTIEDYRELLGQVADQVDGGGDTAVTDELFDYLVDMGLLQKSVVEEIAYDPKSVLGRWGRGTSITPAKRKQLQKKAKAARVALAKTGGKYSYLNEGFATRGRVNQSKRLEDGTFAPKGLGAVAASRNLDRERKRRALARKRAAERKRNRDAYNNHIGAGTPTQSAGSTDDAVFDTDKY